MDAGAEYKHVVLGLIFLKYISDAFEEHLQLEAQRSKGADRGGSRRIPRAQQLPGAAGGEVDASEDRGQANHDRSAR